MLYNVTKSSWIMSPSETERRGPQRRLLLRLRSSSFSSGDETKLHVFRNTLPTVKHGAGSITLKMNLCSRQRTKFIQNWSV